MAPTYSILKCVSFKSPDVLTQSTTPLNAHSGAGYAVGPTIRPIIPERVDTFIFTITNRRNAFTVLGLIFMRCAISLLVNPPSK
jgi:hypothetical protein